MEKLYTANEVTALFKISEVSLWRARKQGKLKFYQFGGLIRFGESHILEYLKSCERINDASSGRPKLRLPVPPSVRRR